MDNQAEGKGLQRDTQLAEGKGLQGTARGLQGTHN